MAIHDDGTVRIDSGFQLVAITRAPATGLGNRSQGQTGANNQGGILLGTLVGAVGRVAGAHIGCDEISFECCT